MGFPILKIVPPDSDGVGLWSARLVHYPFGAAGVPDPEPGFRSVGEGATLESALLELIDEVAARPEHKVEL
jgi:hypothetical protein